MVRFGAGHRREHVHLVHVGAAEHAERGGGPDAAVHVAPAVDAGRLMPARDGAGRDHRVGQRRARRPRPAEQHPPPRVVVHGRDPGPAVGPGSRFTPVQRADQRPQRLVPPPPVRQPAAGPDPRRHLEEQGRARQRQRAGPQVRARRQRSLARGQHRGLAQHSGGLAVLPGHDLVQRRAAAQRGGQHAARARPHHELRVRGRNPIPQPDQHAGHPGRAQYPARPEHQPDPRLGASRNPIRTKDHSRHICLRNPPAHEVT
jgi:hypothetical protein